MLHDRIYNDIKELYDLENLRDQRVLILQKKKKENSILAIKRGIALPENNDDEEFKAKGHSPFVKFMSFMTEEPPTGFYFDETTKNNPEMANTGWEFFKNGFLKMPFNTVFFYADKYLEGKTEADDKALGIWAKLIPETEKIIFFPISAIQNFEGMFYELTSWENGAPNFRAREPDIEGWPPPENLEKIEKEGFKLVQCLCHFLLLLQHPVYETERVEIDKEVNDRRLRKGKNSLSKYIYVRMKPHIKDALSNGTGSIRRPHWRRGHIRRLSDGRVVPVQACLVNWDGNPEEVNKKIYVVKQTSHYKTGVMVGEKFSGDGGLG